MLPSHKLPLQPFTCLWPLHVTHTLFLEVTIPPSYLFHWNHSDMWPGPCSHTPAGMPTLFPERSQRRERESFCQPGPQRISLFLFGCAASINKETTECFRSLSLGHLVTINNLQIHRFLKARLRHFGPTWDCYLWHTTWPVWPCCSVCTWWAFSGTGEGGWRWSHNIWALTASVGDPWKCRVHDGVPGSSFSLSLFLDEYIWLLGSCRH